MYDVKLKLTLSWDNFWLWRFSFKKINMDENTTLVKTRTRSSNYGSSYQEIPLNETSSYQRGAQDSSNRHLTNTNSQELQEIKTVAIGYTFVLFINIGYTLSLITAQLSVGETSIFELNLMRFAFEALVALILIKCGGHTFKVQRKDLLYLLLMMLSYYVYNICYYFAPTVLPLGTMQASFTSVLIICAVIVDLVFKHVNKNTIISAFVCCSGLVLLVQPWNFRLYKDLFGWTVCDIWDSGCPFSAHPNLTNDSCLDKWLFHNSTHVPGQYRYILGVGVDATLFGYLLVFFGAIALCATFNVVRKMSFTYPIPVLVFWVDVMLCVVSAVVTGAVLQDNWTFPSGRWCILSTVGFITLTVIDNLLCFYGYHYLPVSQVSLGKDQPIFVIGVHLKNWHPLLKTFLWCHSIVSFSTVWLEREHNGMRL